MVSPVIFYFSFFPCLRENSFLSFRLLVLVSGFDLVGSSDSVFPIELFIDWATGLIGNPADQSRIVRVIVAGMFSTSNLPFSRAKIFASLNSQETL